MFRPRFSLEGSVESPTVNALEAALGASYTLERELGRGGMATVYLARDVRHRRSVAIKVLHPELSGSMQPISSYQKAHPRSIPRPPTYSSSEPDPRRQAKARFGWPTRDV
jgi:serine/threonine protein kinase